jgi:flagellar basal body L-ring protein FlgH
MLSLSTHACRRVSAFNTGILLSAIGLLLSGCMSTPAVSSKITVPPLPPPKTIGSLWQEENGRAYLYEDLRAMRVGDVLTVKIVEKHKGSKSADTAAQRESTVENSLAGTGMGYIGLPGIRLGDEARRGLGIDASSKNKFNGKGATSREGTLTGTISVIVTEVLPNGDLRIEGRRDVTRKAAHDDRRHRPAGGRRHEEYRAVLRHRRRQDRIFRPRRARRRAAARLAGAHPRLDLSILNEGGPLCRLHPDGNRFPQWAACDARSASAPCR